MKTNNKRAYTKKGRKLTKRKRTRKHIKIRGGNTPTIQQPVTNVPLPLPLPVATPVQQPVANIPLPLPLPVATPVQQPVANIPLPLPLPLPVATPVQQPVANIPLPLPVANLPPQQYQHPPVEDEDELTELINSPLRQFKEMALFASISALKSFLGIESNATTINGMIDEIVDKLKDPETKILLKEFFRVFNEIITNELNEEVDKLVKEFHSIGEKLSRTAINLGKEMIQEIPVVGQIVGIPLLISDMVKAAGHVVSGINTATEIVTDIQNKIPSLNIADYKSSVSNNINKHIESKIPNPIQLNKLYPNQMMQQQQQAVPISHPMIAPKVQS